MKKNFGLSDGFLKFVFIMFVTGLVSITTLPAYSAEIEYHPRFGAIPMDDEVRAAIKKFPDLASCLKTGAVTDGKPNLLAINWDKLRSNGDVKVCLFMVFQQSGGPGQVKKWMVHHGFKVYGPIAQTNSRQLLRRFGYDVDWKNIEENKLITVQGYWKFKGRGPKFPTSGLFRFYIGVILTSQSIHVSWFPDGKLMEVDISHQTIIN